MPPQFSLPYRMPAEWEEHEGTWLTWPQEFQPWEKGLSAVEKTLSEIVSHLSTSEKVYLNINGERQQKHVLELLAQTPCQLNQVTLYDVPSNDVWCRDYGAIFVYSEGKRVALHWKFNAWGNKFEWDLDHQIPHQMAKLTSIPIERMDMVLEGGSIESNGRGILLTTESCLLNSNRNPQWSKLQIEKTLQDYLGVRKILWLPRGLIHDNTDGHIDGITRFIGENTIITVLSEEESNENFSILQQNYELLQTMTNETGQPFSIVTLPMPESVFQRGELVPASYANFYIANTVVLVPQYHDPNDELALQILSNAFPQRRVVGIDCRSVITEHGAIHCLTQPVCLATTIPKRKKEDDTQ